MPRLPLVRVLAVVAGSIAFGVALSLFKGTSGGLRDFIGNLSAPWLLLPFLAGAAWRPGRLAPSAVLGLVASISALAAFYATNTLVLEVGLSTALESGRLFFALGLVSGPVFGLLGGWARRRSVPAAVAMAGFFVLEPAAWLVHVHTLPLASSASYPVVWLAEGLVGALGALAAVVLLRRERAVG